MGGLVDHLRQFGPLGAESIKGRKVEKFVLYHWSILIGSYFMKIDYFSVLSRCLLRTYQLVFPNTILIESFIYSN